MAEEALTREHSEIEELSYIPTSEVRRVRNAITNEVARARVTANIARYNTLYMINRAGSGHIGTSLSAMDLFAFLWSHRMKNPNTSKKDADFFFSSKGHDAPGLYALLIALGIIPQEKIHTLRREGGLPGHPDRSISPLISNTGSLGMGISKARGMAHARRMQKKTGMVYVLTGDGELQEGQIWESLQPTANQLFGEIVAIVDHNKIQSDTYVKDTSDLGDLEAKFKAFNWAVYRIDGNNMDQIFSVFAEMKKETSRPKVLIADTVKGKGVDFMERVNGDNLYRYHSGALSAAEYKTASTQLLEAVQSELGRHGIKPVKTVREELPPKSSSDKKTSLVAAYSDAIVEFGKRKKDFIALDADLTVDLGLLPFKRTFPDRHIQAGIAEQDMVSFAGGLATQGVIPIVHSFACFLTPRANEQIYNNASERTKIIYVGGLAGVLPGMPGHSHQSVRDIAIMNAIPGLAIVEPSDADETRRALEYALTATQSTYIRLTSVPWHIPYTIPKTSLQRPGVGTQVRAGKDIAVIAYGPAMVSEAYEAAALAERDGLRVAVYAFPWLNQTNDKWVAREFGKYKKIVVIDNHYIQGGLGERIQASLQRSSVETACAILGLTDIPPFGQNDEVLKACGFDRQSLVKTLRKMHRAR